MQVGGPVCLATTAVMLTLGVVFSRLWKVEWARRQRAMELRARVRLHALAMDMMKKPSVSPAVIQDPILRRDLLLSLHQQSAMDIRFEVSLKQTTRSHWPNARNRSVASDAIIEKYCTIITNQSHELHETQSAHLYSS